MRSAGVATFLALIVVGCGPFGLWSAFVAIELWGWFAAPWLHVAPPPFPVVYALFAVFGFLRSGRYVKDGRFDWKDATVSSLLSPGLLLITGFIVHSFAGSAGVWLSRF